MEKLVKHTLKGLLYGDIQCSFISLCKYFKGGKSVPDNVNISRSANFISCSNYSQIWQLCLRATYLSHIYFTRETTTILLFNPFSPNAPFLYPLKTSENCKVF